MSFAVAVGLRTERPVFWKPFESDLDPAESDLDPAW